MRGTGVILSTVIVAWMLAVLPMPDWALPFRPEWTLAVMAYWVMALPGRIGIGWCWLAGLALDILMGSLLGQHAIALASAGWLVARLHLQIRVFPPWQQALFILAAVALYEFVIFWTDGIAATRADLRWGPILTTALIWPWLFEVMRSLRRRFKAA